MLKSGISPRMGQVKSIDRVVEAVLREAAFDWEGAPHAAHMACCQEPLRQEPCRPAMCVAGVEGNDYLQCRVRKLHPVDGFPEEDQCILTVGSLTLPHPPT